MNLRGLKALGFASAVLFSAALFSNPAQAVSIGFERITSNSPADAADQLLLEVTDGGTGALFEFTVIDGSNPGASIAEIYFEDSLGLFTPPPLIESQSAGVDFEDPAGDNSPPDLPGGNNASPPFSVTAGLEAEAESGNANAIQVGEILVLRLLYDGTDFAALLTALEDGDFRIGLHVRSLLEGQSDSFVNTPQVPIPAALPLFLTALAGAGFLARRRKQDA